MINLFKLAIFIFIIMLLLLFTISWYFTNFNLSKYNIWLNYPISYIFIIILYLIFGIKYFKMKYNISYHYPILYFNFISPPSIAILSCLFCSLSFKLRIQLCAQKCRRRGRRIKSRMSVLRIRHARTRIISYVCRMSKTHNICRENLHTWKGNDVSTNRWFNRVAISSQHVKIVVRNG